MGRIGLLALCAVLTLPAATVRAEPVEDFYANKTLRLVVSGDAGGGFDLVARNFAAVFSTYLPGKPTILVVNMPGGGGATMANWIYNIAPKDGTVIGMPQATVAVSQLILPEAIRYDAAKMNWIGNIEGSDTVIFTWKTSATQTFEDARKRVTAMAGTGRNSPIYQLLALSNAALGTRFNIVLGYGQNRVIAIESGEVEGSTSTMQNFPGLAPQWVQNGLHDIHLLASNTESRLKEYPQVPTLRELATNDGDRAMFDFLRLQAATARAILAPPGTPPDRVAAMRTAFDRTMADPRFRSEMERMRLDVEPTAGADVQASVGGLIGMPKDVIAKVLDIVK